MKSLTSLLAKGRVEEAFHDKKPLYRDGEAFAEAERCLYCADAPCIKACPTEIDIPTFIKKIASGNVRGSARTILEQNLLGYSCARVCPVEELCVGSCVYNGWGREPISIGRLQRYATEKAAADGQPPVLTPAPQKSGKKVVCIGAGPASLAFAGTMALAGHEAVILEKRDVAGGLNTTGIAPYKLKSEDALREVEWVLSLGVELRTGVTVGDGGVRGSELLSQYDAVFLGVGLGDDTRLNVPGEQGPGVVGATAWIEKMKLSADGKPKGRVIVVGGGNTAIDVARECALLGCDVTMVYRRSKADMSGYAHEWAGAVKEGVRMIDEAVPVAFVRNDTGSLWGVRLARTIGGKPVAGAEFEVRCDLAVIAIGQSKLHALAADFEGVSLDKRGCFVVDPKTCQTGNPKVFAGGDAINGGKEVVNAVADGRNAARHLQKLWAEKG